MESLLIIGAGSYGMLVKEIASLVGYKTIVFLDDMNPCAIGTIGALEDVQEKYDGAIIAVGNCEIREKLLGQVLHPVSLIHPHAWVSPSAVVGKACVIEAGAVVNAYTEIGDSCFVCAGAVVNHHAVIESYCQIDCNAVVESMARVKRKTKVESCSVYHR